MADTRADTTPTSSPDSVTMADIRAAAARLATVARRTPVLTSRTVDARVGATVFFKAEPFQRAGAFKFRGAYNALANLPLEARARGVLTFSSGNHAQATALAGQVLSVPVTVVMPQDAPPVKLAATRGYGAEVVLYDRAGESREAIARRLAGERGLTLIPPYDHPHVIAGQGTTAKELFEDVGPLDVLLVPCGGGGLLSGCAVAAAALSPGCRVIGVEPAQADDAARSFRTGVLHTVHEPDTVADGARTPSLGSLTFPLIRRHVHDFATVSEEAILEGMFFLWTRVKAVVEPTGALAASALLAEAILCRGARVGVVLSGGNVDPAAIPGYLRRLERS